MYSVIFNGEVKGMCDYPNYVKKVNNIWINCTKDDHEAIAIGGVAYPGAIAKKNDSGEVVFGQGVQLDDASNRISTNDDALMELAEMVSEQEDALIELASRMED